MAIVIDTVLDIGNKLIDRLWPDPAKRDEAKLALLKLQQDGDLKEIAGQLEINKIEAANHNLFISGWRPFVGWVCGGGMAIALVVGPLLAAVGVTVPPLPVDVLLTMLGGLLGLGGFRTYEKVRGVAAR